MQHDVCVRKVSDKDVKNCVRLHLCLVLGTECPTSKKIDLHSHISYTVRIYKRIYTYIRIYKTILVLHQRHTGKRSDEYIWIWVLAVCRRSNMVPDPAHECSQRKISNNSLTSAMDARVLADAQSLRWYLYLSSSRNDRLAALRTCSCSPSPVVRFVRA